MSCGKWEAEEPVEQNSIIMIAGGNGVAGSAIARALSREGFASVLIPSHGELDLTDQGAVDGYFEHRRPEYVFFVAAKMGSIVYRKEHPADILEQNLLMQTNVLRAAHRSGVKKLLFMSSDFIYPNTESGILREEDFLSNIPGQKDLPYSLAKITGIQLCNYYRQQFGDDFFAAVPCAFFGQNASFDLDRASVVAALVRRFHEAKVGGAKELVLWGSGKPVKEFLLSDDIADACLFLMKNYREGGIVNIGAGDGGHTIMETAQIIRDVTGFPGEITCDLSKPDGIMRRVMDSSKLQSLGWKPRYGLREAVTKMYEYFLTTEFAK